MSTTPTTSVIIHDEPGLRRRIGRTGLLFTSVGSIIGSGWLFGAFYATQAAGPAAIISWVLGAAMVIAISLSYAELGVMFPLSGAAVRYPHYAFGSLASFTTGWVNWVSVVATVPLEVLAAIQYSSAYIPGTTHTVAGTTVLTPLGTAIGVGFLALFSVINVLGVKLFERVNNVLVWWKLAVILLVGITLVTAQFNFGHFDSRVLGGFAPGGVGAIFTALPAAGIVFSYLGFRSAIEFAGETDNPRRNVPFAVIGSLVIAAIIYILIQVAFVGAVPAAELKKGWEGLTLANNAGPLAQVALLLGITWLAIVIYADAVVSPMDTGFVYSALTPRMSYAQAKLGNAPRSLAKLNSRGAPWVSIILMFVVGCLMFLPFPSWSKLVGFATSGAVIVFATGPISVAALRRQLPDQPRPFRLPGKDTLPLIGFICANLILYWTGWSTDSILFLSVLVGYAILFVYTITSRHRDTIPPLQLKASWWIVLWLGGAAVISWIGHYDGLDILGLGWGEAVVIVFAAGVFYVGVHTRLSSEEAALNVTSTTAAFADQNVQGI